MDRAELVASKAFLGTEFLTWLWFRSEADEGKFSPGGEAVQVFVDDRMSLETAFAHAATADLSGGEPSSSAEAQVALREGKTLVAGSFRLLKGEREWAFRLKGRTLDLGPVRLPALLTRAMDDRFYERMALLDELDGLLQQLFASFLHVRLSPAWAGELAAMRAWVARA